MPLRSLETATELVHQISGPEDAPAVIYLPGVQGDWTANEAARTHLSRETRLIEVAYPRTSTWSLADFSNALQRLLDRLGLTSVHVAGESFGSLVAWETAFGHPQRIKSLLLVGGFAQPPAYRVATSAKWALRGMPTIMLEAGIDVYVYYKGRKGEQRLGRSLGVAPYTAVRTRRGKLATANRMAIIERTDMRERLHRVRQPVRYIGGDSDTVIGVHRELSTLQQQLPAHCEFECELIQGGPHAIIASHPERTARTLTRWILDIEQSRETPAGDQPSE
jgi:pimeloyl-ACP methyl ester carboxylesterase